MIYKLKKIRESEYPTKEILFLNQKDLQDLVVPLVNSVKHLWKKKYQ